VPEEPIS
jgi:hypothetical protein